MNDSKYHKNITKLRDNDAVMSGILGGIVLTALIVWVAILAIWVL